MLHNLYSGTQSDLLLMSPFMYWISTNHIHFTSLNRNQTPRYESDILFQTLYWQILYHAPIPGIAVRISITMIKTALRMFFRKKVGFELRFKN